jgi:hypothetical protein
MIGEAVCWRLLLVDGAAAVYFCPCCGCCCVLYCVALCLLLKPSWWSSPCHNPCSPPAAPLNPNMKLPALARGRGTAVLPAPKLMLCCLLVVNLSASIHLHTKHTSCSRHHASSALLSRRLLQSGCIAICTATLVLQLLVPHSRFR